MYMCVKCSGKTYLKLIQYIRIEKSDFTGGNTNIQHVIIELNISACITFHRQES